MKDNYRTADQKPQSNGKELCPHCGGKGRIPTNRKTGKRTRTKVCMLCRGTGTFSGNYMTK